VHPDDLTPYLTTATQAFDRRDSFRMQYRLRRHDGEFRWVLDAGVPRTTLAGAFAGYLGSCIDITEHKRSHEVLGALSRRLMEAQESERSWIARELHEDLVQRTVALSWQMSKLAGAMPSDAGERALLQEMCEQATALGHDLQSISLRLHSFKLEYLGIVMAVTGFCMELSKQHGIDIDVDDDGVPENIPIDMALALFRVLQEALLNAVKHSGARRIQVVLRGGPAEIQLAVIDNGVGFDPEAAMRRHALGLVGMQERLRSVEGQMLIESRPSAGTAVHVRVPFRSNAKTHGCRESIQQGRTVATSMRL
jgi:signal transduction histidine kinase